MLVVLALAILTIIGAAQGSSQIERWGHISAIWVIIPVLISGIVILAIVGGSAYGMSKLLGKMPEWLLKAQLFMVHLALTVRRAADAATKPIMASNTLSARVSTLWGRLFHRRTTPAP